MGQSVVNWYTKGDRLTPDEVSLMYADLSVNGLRAPARNAPNGSTGASQ
jgi:hypothetical protein